MRGKVTDEKSMDRIVSQGILPAIKTELEKDTKTIDSRVAAIGNLIKAYDEYYLTGRK